MKVLVGLGNPGPRYRNTRHNVGFLVVERVASHLSVALAGEKYNGIVAEGEYQGERVLLVKPQTFMNNSGDCVARVLRYKPVKPAELVVAVDDVNLALGRIRIRPAGSAGGHNGLKSIIQHLGTDEFPRVRLGVGGADRDELIDHVLGTFRPDEKPVVQEMVDRAAEAMLEVIASGVESAMNKFN